MQQLYTTGSTSRTAYVANDIVHCIHTHPLITHACIHTPMHARIHTPMHIHTCMLHSVDLSVNIYIHAYIHMYITYINYVHTMYVCVIACVVSTLLFCVFNRSQIYYEFFHCNEVPSLSPGWDVYTHKGEELYCSYTIFLKIDHINLCIRHSTKGSETTEGLLELPCPASWG